MKSGTTPIQEHASRPHQVRDKLADHSLQQKLIKLHDVASEIPDSRHHTVSKLSVNLTLIKRPSCLYPHPRTCQQASMSSFWLETQLISQISYQSTALHRVISLLAACLEKAFHWGRTKSQHFFIVYFYPTFIWSQQLIRLGV